MKPRSLLQLPLLPVLLMVTTACTQAAPPAASASAASSSMPASGATHTASASMRKEKTAWEKERFAIEKAMGASCRHPGSDGVVEELPFEDANCSGRPPAHLLAFIRHIPVGGSLRQRTEEEQQYYKAIPGLGKRPDFLVDYGLAGFWVRSFEGADPDTTVYLVHGPVCDYEEKGSHCLSESEELRNIRLYRTHKGGAPQDVTDELLPPVPTMTRAEKRRYGIYLRPKGLARDGDIKLDISRITYVPVLRWTIRPAHDEREDFYHPPKSIPDTDPRVYKEYYRTDLHNSDNNVHYGFLVWNGERFELREKVPADLWPCRYRWTANKECPLDYESRIDRYLTEPSSQDNTLRSTAS